MSELEENKGLPKLDIQIISFLLGNERFGIPLRWVKEVLDSDFYSVIPRAPMIVSGAINNKGKIYTIINLSSLFDVPRNWEKDRSVLLLEVKDFLIGIEVFKKMEITLYDEEILKGGFYSITLPKSPFVKEFFRYEDKIINMIDIDYILKEINSLLN